MISLVGRCVIVVKFCSTLVRFSFEKVESTFSDVAAFEDSYPAVDLVVIFVAMGKLSVFDDGSEGAVVDVLEIIVVVVAMVVVTSDNVAEVLSVPAIKANLISGAKIMKSMYL